MKFLSNWKTWIVVSFLGAILGLAFGIRGHNPWLVIVNGFVIGVDCGLSIFFLKMEKH